MDKGKKEHMEAAAKKLLDELGDMDLSEAKSISVVIDMVGSVPKKKKEKKKEEKEDDDDYESDYESDDEDDDDEDDEDED